MTIIVMTMVGYDNDENLALFFSEVHMIMNEPPDVFVN